MSTIFVLLAIIMGVVLVRFEYKRTQRSQKSIKESDTPIDTRTNLAQSIEHNADIVVDFVNSGKRVLWNPQHKNLLEFASAQGVATEFLCRQGQCGTCQTKVLEGEVIYLSSPEFAVESGKCLLCIGSPKANLSLEL